MFSSRRWMARLGMQRMMTFDPGFDLSGDTR
jgi:hypothetical protein